MGNPKLPVDVILANGNASGLTKAEIEERRATELKSPDIDIVIPDFLTSNQDRCRFLELANMIQRMGVWSTVDGDQLARYVVAQRNFERISDRMDKVDISDQDGMDEYAKLLIMQTKAFDQAQKAANGLCLNITSRCKVTIPSNLPPEKKKNKFAAFEVT